MTDDDPAQPPVDRPDSSEGGRELQAANAFDLRRIIGGLFLLYGVVLTIVGATDGSAEVSKAAGVRINLWAGLGMLVLGDHWVRGVGFALAALAVPPATIGIALLASGFVSWWAARQKPFA